MVHVQTETVIDCSKEKVVTYAAHPSHAPEWYVNIESAEWLTDEVVEKGSQVAFKASFLGRELSYVYEIVEYEPGHKMVMRTVNGPFPMETTYTWKALGDHRTLMILQNKGEPRGFSKAFTPFMSFMMKKANKKDLEKLKQMLERNR